MTQLEKLSVITALVGRSPTPLGRTALMKCLFFLKTLRGVPLPYKFGLYTYGPFDSNVLDDLSYTEALGAVKSSIVAYPGGYGYQLEVGPEAKRIEQLCRPFLDKHRDSIKWVLDEFSSRSALDLEMASTLIFVDRSFAQNRMNASVVELANKVQHIKPHLEASVIQQEAQNMLKRNLLVSVPQHKI